MRFNTKELAHYASTRFGKADKEGALWMKEYEGILKKKESELCWSMSISVSRDACRASFCSVRCVHLSQPIHRDGSCSLETCSSTAEPSTR